ncbi:2-Hydroxyacid oxidase 2-like [Ptychodera flava]|uniref:2-Hydroxyacid oxidase 2-like n=1 Tax=Ptychodera flava TaxID=63121 RepID=UPI003969EBFC
MVTDILGQRIGMPICISPTALHNLAHPEAEIATCKAAAEMNTILIMSAASSKSIEDIAALRQTSIKWQLVYTWRDRGVTKDMIRRAEKAGFKAIVLSVDLPVLGVKRRLLKDGRQTILRTLQQSRNLYKYIGKDLQIGEGFPAELMTSSAGSTWEDITWIKTMTTLPVILKGIVTVEDAVLAAEHNVQGIIVSNHGGRQLDGVPATIDVLSDIVDAVGDKLEVYVDGGIRTGTDVLKALALGARAVFIGRPVLYGLACDGEEGVKSVLQILRDELRRAMALTGCSRISDISRDLLSQRDRWSKL